MCLNSVHTPKNRSMVVFILKYESKFAFGFHESEPNLQIGSVSMISISSCFFLLVVEVDRFPTFSMVKLSDQKG